MDGRRSVVHGGRGSGTTEVMTEAMRRYAGELLGRLDDDRAAQARRDFDDDRARRWIEYRPEPRPGVSLADLNPAGRKAAHQLLACALSTHAFAQADDIISYTRPQAPERTEPLGVPAAQLGATARALLDHLLAVYLDRLRPELAAAETARLREGELHFAWAGPVRPGHGHYYRIQGPDLLVEYDNTQNGANHAHTVLRRPHSDFGDDVLARHYASAG